MTDRASGPSFSPGLLTSVRPHYTIAEDAHLSRMVPRVVLGGGDPRLDRMQAVVGGYIETAFRMDSPIREGVTIDAYCNEEGMLFSGVPVIRITPRNGGEPMVFAGPLVFAGANDEGESVPLLKAEAQWLWQEFLRTAEIVGLTRGN